MRPVVIVASNNPILRYSAGTQLGTRAYRGRDILQRGRWDGVTMADVVSSLNDLTNSWIANKAPLTKSKTPSFAGNVIDENLYEEFTKLLFDEGGWGNARRDLIGQIGQYCSYCGSPIFSHLHIEHVLPKTFFPNQIFEWSNFLLACATCNSAKGNKPNQTTLSRRPKSTAESVDYINNKNSMNYLWPFFDWSSFPQDPSPSYPFRFLLCEAGKPESATAKTLHLLDEIDEPTVLELLNRFERGALSHERSLYFYPKGNGKQYIGVKVEAKAPYDSRLPRLWRAASEIVKLANLNTVRKSSDSANSVDFRIFNRTTAYLRALLLRRRIEMAIEGRNRDLFLSLVELAKITVKNTGFWPIWAQVLGNLDLKGIETQAFLRDIFPGTAPVKWNFPYLIQPGGAG